jgi:hypothetical protein
MRDFLVSLAFFLLCGICTAVLLWQSRRLLFNLAHRRTFVAENAKYMTRASFCLYGISSLALIRTLVWLTYMNFAQVLMAYNTLFIPVFFIAGLLFHILAELFYEASAIKEENDLTI